MAHGGNGGGTGGPHHSCHAKASERDPKTCPGREGRDRADETRSTERVGACKGGTKRCRTAEKKCCRDSENGQGETAIGYKITYFFIYHNNEHCCVFVLVSCYSQVNCTLCDSIIF